MHVVDLEKLKHDGRLWQGRQGLPGGEQILPSGWAVLDEALGGGWPRRALVEVISDAHQGLSLLLPLLARLSRGERWLAWVGPPYVPYAPALVGRGVHIGRLLLVRDVSAEQCLWATEQALKSAACGLVLAWPERIQVAQLRRLQLAAEQGDCPGILFREARALHQGSPAAVRLRVWPSPLGLEVEVLKRRGAWGGARCIVPIQDNGEASLSVGG